MHKRRRRLFGSSALVLLALLSLTGAVLTTLTAVLYAALTADLPPIDQVARLMDPDVGLTASPTVVLDRTGTHELATVGIPLDQRGYVTFSALEGSGIAQELVDATVAILDPSFWEHPGFFYDSAVQPETDTIATRLVNDLLLWQEPAGLRRSLRANLLAAQLIATYGHEQVLEWFLNSAHYGNHAFGAEAAARLYFGRSATRLSLSEAAVLAAASAAPDLNPFRSPDLALEKRDEVLLRMLEQGLITNEAYQAATEQPLGVRTQQTPPVTEVTPYIEVVLDQIAPFVPLEVLARGGYEIRSTLDLELQRTLVCVLKTQLARLEDPVSAEEGKCDAARLLPSLPGEVIPSVSGEVVVLDPRLGQVLALAALESGLQAPQHLRPHPPGSILTPFVYLYAFSRGFGPASLVWDIPAYLPSTVADSPNFDEVFHGPMRARLALASDYLVPPLHLLGQFGPSTVWDAASLSGLPSLSGETELLILSGGEVALMEITHAFSAFNTQGVLIGYPVPDSRQEPTPLQPSAVLQVESRKTPDALTFGPAQARPVMSAPLAYALTHVLSDESARWPAFGHPNPMEIGRPAGVKSGFTQDGGNGWTVGFTPQLAVGVWLGTPEQVTKDRTLAPTALANAAAGIWHAIMVDALRDQPVEGWSMPPGIEEVEVCDPSGQLPTRVCPVVVREIFLPGTAPVHTDQLYREVEINRETGLLATIFTPPSLVEPRVFLVPPPEAHGWAQQAGLDIPPENYDLVSQPPAPSPDARITSPEMFAYLSGEVIIQGSATGSGFQSFSVQVGQGLNPQQWLQLAEPSNRQVQNGELATWDTSGLRGLYAIRLLVVREDNLVETHILQVTVDNVPPQVEILYPDEGQTFTLADDTAITVQLSAQDDLLLNRVEVYLDGVFERALTQPPFAVAWNLTPGEHTLQVVAVDQAGNRVEAERSILVEGP